ncbi:MAG: DUF2079 domain-containing protein [Anaerolineae bacterium]|nr:DUF2079 domain-containing protein [Anaerolineae bacterium]
MHSAYLQPSPTVIGSRPSRSFGMAAAVGLIVVFTLIFAVFAVGRYERYNATSWDLGIFVQLTWNAAQGRPLQNTVAEQDNMLGIHAPYITVLLAPLFWLWSDARILLIAQSVLLCLGALPIAVLVRRKFKEPWLPPLFVLVWMLYPALGWINRWDFHEIAPVVAFLAFAFEAADRKAWPQVDLWLILALLCKEEIGLTVAFFGLYSMQKFGRNWRAVLLWFVIGVAWFTIHAFVIFPLLRNADNGLPIHASRYAWILDGDLSSMINYALGSDTLLKLSFLLKLFAPVAFLSLLEPLVLLPAVPTFAFSLLANYEPQFNIYMHYTAPIIPAVMVSAVYGLAWLRQSYPRLSVRAIAGVMLACVLIAWTLYNPFFMQPVPNGIYGWEPGAHVDSIEATQAIIPAGACVVAGQTIQPHYATRQQSYVIGKRGDMDGCQYMILDLGDTRHHDFTDDRQVACYQYWSGKRAPIFYQDTVVVLEWNPAPTNPQAEQDLAAYCSILSEQLKT